MKIICVGRNYKEHAKELQNDIPTSPVIFLKPDTALLKDNQPFFYPSFSKDIHYETEVVFKIGKEGKFIQEKFAHKYIESIGLGIDFTARDLQQELKSKGLPWELSKGFNGSAVVHLFEPAEGKKWDDLHFYLQKNGEIVQRGHTKDMMFGIEQIISFVSTYFTLKKGDLIFTGTPAGVGPVAVGDRLQGFLEDQEMFSFEIK